MRGVILEGVAGTGKSTLLERLRGRGLPRPLRVVAEEETLGELFDELRAPASPPRDHLRRLRSVLAGLDATDEAFVVLGRFHPSDFALGLEWPLLAPFDEALARLDFGLALLDVGDDRLRARSLFRPERAADGWADGFVHDDGSAEAAVAAFAASQRRRRDCLALSRLRHRIIDTSAGRWDEHLEGLVGFCLSGDGPADRR